MKAIRVHEFGPPEVMQVVEVDRPTPVQGQVLVRVHAVGVNPVETYQRSGQYARLPVLPYTPGTDAAGGVEAVGEGVDSPAVGDRVYTVGSLSGTYAEYALCTPSQLYPLPPSSTYEAGAALGVAGATAWRALFHKARARAGETVLIHGATGGVGTIVVQLARAAGLQVAGTGGSPEGRALAERLGAHRVFDHHEEGYLAAALEFTHGRGFDAIIEFAAHANLQKDFGALATGGRIVVVGNWGPIEINARDLMSRDGTVHAMVLFNTSAEDLVSIHAGLYAALEAKTLQPVVDQVFPLSDAARAHRAQIESRGAGEIILRIAD